MRLHWVWFGSRIGRVSALQWAPTLTSHDPNPPMTLEDATTPTPTPTVAVAAPTGAGGRPEFIREFYDDDDVLLLMKGWLM